MSQSELSEKAGEQSTVPANKDGNYTDGRGICDWQTRYPIDARKSINAESAVLAIALLLLTLFNGFLLGISNEALVFNLPLLTQQLPDGSQIPAVVHLNPRLLLTYFVGCLGGTMYSIKWLVHSVAKCKWHLDRRYWRFFVPLMGGVYACVLLTLLDSGLIGFPSSGTPKSIGLIAAYAFLVGYFSDGVSGLLSNLANAIFGTLDKK